MGVGPSPKQIAQKVFDDSDDTIRTKSGLSVFSPPIETDAFTLDLTSATQEVYKFRSGGIAGTVLKTVTLNYTDSTKDDLLNGTIS